MAAADQFEIIVNGRQTHGSTPWRGVDPIVVGAQIVNALQTIVSRNVDITRLPAIVTVGQFQSGVRNNIIPDTARLVGTIRTFDDEVQADIHARVKKIAEAVAMGAGATVDVKIDQRAARHRQRSGAHGADAADARARRARTVKESELITGAEDFTFFQREVPGLFFFLGITPKAEMGKAPRESLAAVLRRREGAADRRSRPGQPGRRLHAIVWYSLIHEWRHEVSTREEEALAWIVGRLEVVSAVRPRPVRGTRGGHAARDVWRRRSLLA